MEKNKDPMQIITESFADLSNKEKREELGSALHELFDEFKEAYKEERDRMRQNEILYRAEHWDAQEAEGDPNAPKPVTPIIFSTIENIKADMMEDIPAPVFKPENKKDSQLARALTKIVQQDLEAGDWENEYSQLCSDILTYGWAVNEVGFDPYGMQGRGCAFIRRVAPFSFMCDPLAENLQDGRACFKYGRRTKEWFRQHYPDLYEEIDYETTTYEPKSSIYESSATNETQDIVECWVKVFDTDTKETSVHMALIAGDVLLEVSADEKPEGYYMHGQYPFALTPLYPVSGTPWGIGIPDIHKSKQLYSDKLDQIMLKNAYLASHNKLLVTEGSGFDAEDLADWTKDVHEGDSLNGVTWFPTPPLPSYYMVYLQQMRNEIKTESGANDQARGQTASGVTAASAIQSLQDMATKRSRMHIQNLHSKIRASFRMLLDVEREFAQSDRIVVIMSDGSPIEFAVTPKSFSRLGDDGKPIEYHIIIETARQARYTKISQNELALQIGRMFANTIDPISILYMMDFQDKDIVIEMLQDSRNSQLKIMEQQIGELTQMVEQLSEQNKQYADSYAQVQGALAANNYREQAMAQRTAPLAQQTEEEADDFLAAISEVQ